MRQFEVFVSGDEGYHTYRIPSLAVSNEGAVLAFCEGRKESYSDHGDIHLMMRRSHDGGRNWGGMIKIWSEEHDDRKVTCGNPTSVVDRETGTIWLFFTRNNNTVYFAKSDDGGLSWSTPEDITGSVKQEDWTWYATGPGHGIQLSGGAKAGRLLIPCNHREKKGARISREEVPEEIPGSENHCHVIYSDDHGDSWFTGESVPLPAGTLPDAEGMYFAGNECQLVEIPGGKVYLNTRGGTYAMQSGCRKYSWSSDGGDSWEPLREEKILIEPCCHASIYGGTQFPMGRNAVLFANPAHHRERIKLTVRGSYDDCRSWPFSKMLHEGPSAYAELAVLDDGTVLCLYEGGKSHYREWIRLARFKLSEPA